MNKYFDIKKDNNIIKCKSIYKSLDNIDTVILSCHGFTGSKDNKTAALLGNTLIEKKDNVMILTFDLPAHGDDKNTTISLDKCNDYIDIIIEYLQDELKIDNIYAQGTSFGGYLLLKYIIDNKNPFKKIALRCPAVNMYDTLINRILTKEQIKNITNGDNIKLGYDRETIINNSFVDDLKNNDINKKGLFNKYNDEIVVFHGNMDTLIDYEVVRKFCYMNKILFIPVLGADHGFNNGNTLSYCISGIESFFNIDKTISKKNITKQK